MKKTLTILISVLLLICVLCSCTTKSTKEDVEKTKKPQKATAETVTKTAVPTDSDETETEAPTETKAPVATPEITPMPQINAEKEIPLIEALLLGAKADTAESDVSKWTDAEFINVIYGKLNNSSSWEDLNLNFSSTDDGYLKFNLTQIQKIAKDMFNRELPTNITLMHTYVSEDSFFIMPADGSRTKLEVQTAETKDQYTVAKGVITTRGGTSTLDGFFEATLVKNEQCVYGYTLVSLKSMPATAKANLTATASSTLEDNKISYVPKNVLDNNLATAWVEGVTGLGEGQWIMISTTDNSKITLSAIEFALGYQDPKNPDLLDKNSAPSKVRIECENGYSEEFEFYSFDDIAVLDSVQNTSWVKITIVEAFKGTTFDDTCISEIRIFELNS